MFGAACVIFLYAAMGWEAKPCFPPVRFCPCFRNSCGCVRTGEENEEALYRRTPLLFHEILQNLAAHTEGQNSRIPQPAARLRALLDRHLYDSLSISDFPARQISRLPS